MMVPVALEIRDLVAGYGRVPVLRNVTAEIAAGKITVLLGHNGAGKSTLAKAVMGLVDVTAGSLILEGRELRWLPTAERLNSGVSLVLQEQAVFSELSVLDNLRVAGRCKRYTKFEFVAACAKAYALFPILEEFKRRAATSLSGGQQRMLAIAMGMMTGPRCLILDEPSVGLSPKLVNEVMSQIAMICRQMGVTIFLVEQNVEAALQISDRVIAIRHGEIIFTGMREELSDTKAIVELL